MLVEGKSRTVFFPSDTLIYAISRDSSKDYNIRTCEHMILGQLWMGARQTNYAPLPPSPQGTPLTVENPCYGCPVFPLIACVFSG